MSSETLATAAAPPTASTTALRAAAATRRDELLLSARDVGKCYEIYARPLDRLKQTLFRGRRQFYREFWALRHVSFDLQRGQTVGIVGRNGSGKSTLLQILAGTMSPTEGEVTVNGRVHALLELGSGFNPEFTGRENVFLNGAVLGLSRKQIAARFDEIAAFADIGEFLDQPIRTYSTGMVVRLAFAVQALLEPDLLIVDEALAVGDAAFQIKCVHRMRQLISRGTSVILVSHDVNAVRQFCQRAIWLNGGEVALDGPPLDVTGRYVQSLFEQQHVQPLDDAEAPPATTPAADSERAPTIEAQRRQLTPLAQQHDVIRWGSGELQIQAVAFDNGTPGDALLEFGGKLCVEVEVRALRDVSSTSTGLACAIRNTKGLDVIAYTTWEAGHTLPTWAAGQKRRARFVLDNILAPGDYALVLAAEDIRGGARHYFDFVENAAILRVTAQQPIFSMVQPRVWHAWLDDHGAVREFS